MSNPTDEAPPTKQEVLDELHACARFGEIDDLKMMVEGDDTGPLFDVNGKDDSGNTAVHKAAANGHVDMLKYLLELKADYALNDNGIGPLSWAVLNNQKDAVKFLIDNYSSKINVVAKPTLGKSIVSLAHDCEDQEIAVMILKHPSAAALEEMISEAPVEEGDEDEKQGETDGKSESSESQSNPPSSTPETNTASAPEADSATNATETPSATPSKPASGEKPT